MPGCATRDCGDPACAVCRLARVPTGDYRHAYERMFELSEAELARRGKTAQRQRMLETRPAEPEADLFTGKGEA